METRTKIQVTGFVDKKTFLDYLSASDVCVNLRYPSQGETSSALLSVFAAGKPAIIPEYRQFRDFPRDICVHVDLSPNQTMSVYLALKALRNDPDERTTLGIAAREYVHSNHQVELTAEKYIAFIQKQIRKQKRVVPLAERCELDHVRVMPIEDQVAVTLANWPFLTSDNEMINEMATIITELGLDE